MSERERCPAERKIIFTDACRNLIELAEGACSKVLYSGQIEKAIPIYHQLRQMTTSESFKLQIDMFG